MIALPILPDTERFQKCNRQEGPRSYFNLALTGSIVLELFAVSSSARVNDACRHQGFVSGCIGCFTLLVSRGDYDQRWQSLQGLAI